MRESSSTFRRLRVPWLAGAWLVSGLARASEAPAPSATPPSDLPADAPRSSQVVYDLKYRVKNANEIEVGYTYLVGDKFLATQGVSIDDRYHLSEQFAVGAGFSIFGSSISPEAGVLAQQGVAPFAYDPGWILRATGLYEPVYGKFLVGGAIIHFKLGVEAGIHLAHEQSDTSSGYTADTGTLESPYAQSSGLRAGPLLGLRFETFLSQSMSVIGSAQFMAHGTLEGDTSASWRTLWAYGLSAGYRF